MDKEDVDQLARCAYRMVVEGDDVVDELFKVLFRLDYTDEDGLWIEE